MKEQNKMHTIIWFFFVLLVCLSAEQAWSAHNLLYFGRRLEPRGRVVIHGIGQHPRAFREYYDTIGAHKPLMYMMYRHINSRKPLKTRRFEEYPDYIIPQVGITMKGAVQKINAGAYDSVIVSLAGEFAKTGRPAYVRLGYEFNGEWNEYEPESFVNAWRRIVTTMRANGCDQIAFVWCYAVEGADCDYMSYYPGDDYVDWWAIDLFSPEHLTSRATHRFIEHAAQKRYPVMIGESSPRWIGAQQGERSWRVWFDKYFDLIHEHKNIKAFSYITYDWADEYELPYSLHDWGDARVWRDSLVFSRWKEELAHPRYLHGASEKRIKQLLGVKTAK